MIDSKCLSLLPCIVEFLFLLLNLAINLLSDLSKLQLRAKNFVLLLFESSFSLFKSSLELLLLHLKTTALFVKFMDWASSISKLVKKISDFISKILVLPLDNIKLLNNFIMGCPQTEEFTVKVARFFLAGINFGSKVFRFGFPFSNDLNSRKKLH